MATASAVGPSDQRTAGERRQVDLLVRLRDVVEFADRTVLGADREHRLWRVDLGQVSGFEKMLLEASVLAVLVDRTHLVDDRVAALVRSIGSRCDRPGLLRMLRRQPRLVTTLGTTLIVLDRFGETTAEEHRVLEAALDSPFVECTERTPFRLLDRSWILGLAGRSTRHDGAALELCSAARRTHPIYLGRDDVYAITHSVMYATDFGARKPEAALLSESLDRSIDACLAWCLSVHDFDLVAELLLAQLLLRGRLSTYGRIAWQVSRRMWDRLTFLPGPSLSAGDLLALPDDAERRQYAHYHMYHTIFVAGLLVNALLTLHARPLPADVVVTRPQPAGDGGADAADRSDADSFASMWSGAGEPADLQRIALDAALIRQAKAYDLDALSAELHRAASGGAITDTVSVAAAFLEAQTPEVVAAAGGGVQPSAAIR